MAIARTHSTIIMTRTSPASRSASARASKEIAQMAVIPSDIAQPFIRRESIVGPVTSARHRRNAMVYVAMCVLGLVPTILGMSPEMQAFGLGLWIPGGRLLSVGGWAILLFPMTI